MNFSEATGKRGRNNIFKMKNFEVLIGLIIVNSVKTKREFNYSSKKKVKGGYQKRRKQLRN